MDLVLDSQEKQTALGKRLLDHFTGRLNELRIRNDKSMAEADRANLIADIKVTRDMVKALSDAK